MASFSSPHDRHVLPAHPEMVGNLNSHGQKVVRRAIESPACTSSLNSPEHGVSQSNSPLFPLPSCTGRRPNLYPCCSSDRGSSPCTLTQDLDLDFRRSHLGCLFVWMVHLLTSRPSCSHSYNSSFSQLSSFTIATTMHGKSRHVRYTSR